MHVHILLCILQSSESSSLNPLTNHSTGNSSGSSDHDAVLDETPNLTATASSSNQNVPIVETPDLTSKASSSDQLCTSSNTVTDSTNPNVHEASKDVE